MFPKYTGPEGKFSYHIVDEKSTEPISFKLFGTIIFLIELKREQLEKAFSATPQTPHRYFLRQVVCF